MRIADFYQRVADVFGKDRGEWILHSHILSGTDATADQLFAQGTSPQVIWDKLCQDFEVSESDYWGIDR